MVEYRALVGRRVRRFRRGGKRAPQRDGADRVEREAYRDEVIAVGFWAGDANVGEPTYYTYTVPEPQTLTQNALQPAGAAWIASGSGHMGTLPYEVVRTADDPGATLLLFLRSAYAAGSRAGAWDTASLAGAFSSDER